jgi:putative endonuclease
LDAHARDSAPPLRSNRARAMAYRPKTPCVYILASRRNGTLYIGVTSDLPQRVTLHKQDLIEGFTKKYGVHRLVYYEMHPTMDAAILREKRLKEWRRLWKIRLIESMNPEWIDLFDERTGEILDGPADLSRTR